MKPESRRYGTVMFSVFFFGLLMLSGCHRAQVLPAASTADSSEPNFTQARTIVHGAAADLDVSTRTTALSNLILLHPGGGVWAERALWDPSPWVRRAAIHALAARLPEAESRVALISFAQREGMDPYSRCSAAGRLALDGDFTTLSVVQSAYREADELWLAAPCALAAAMMGDAAAIAVLAEVLSEGELPLELGFVSDLGGAGLEPLIPSMLVAMDMVEPSMEIALAAALVQMNDKRGRTRLERVLGGSSEELQLEVIDTISPLSSPLVDPILLRVSRGGTPALQRAALLSLIGRGVSEPTPAVALLVHEDREVRSQAVHALGGWLQHPDAPGGRRAAKMAREGVLVSLGDAEDMVLLEGIRALGNGGNSGDVVLLAPLLEVDAARVQLAAAGALLLLASSEDAED